MDLITAPAAAGVSGKDISRDNAMDSLARIEPVMRRIDYCVISG
jgi:hypothetical protein